MVKAGGGKMWWLKRQTLQFGVKYGGWQKSAEMNYLCIAQESQITAWFGEAKSLGRELIYASPGFDSR